MTMNNDDNVDLPTVSVLQREYSIVEGSPLSINCQVDSNPAPTIISWRSATVGGKYLLLLLLLLLFHSFKQIVNIKDTFV